MAIINDGSGVSGLGIEATSKAARVRLYNADGTIMTPTSGEARETNQEYMPLAGLNDDNLRALSTNRKGNLHVGLPIPLYNEPFEGTTFPAARTAQVAATMAAAQTAANGLQFNSASITTVNTGFYVRSARSLPRIQFSPMHYRARARFLMQANAVAELGFHEAIATVNAVNTTGAYWQVTSGGAVVPVLTFSSTDITGSDISGSLSSSNYYIFDVIVEDDKVTYTCQNSANGLIISEQVIRVPTTQGKVVSATHLHAFARLYNTAVAPSTAPQIFVSRIDAIMHDVMIAKSAGAVAAGTGLGLHLQPVTVAQLANYVNSTAPASATLSNTAAGYTTLGGQFQFAAPAGAATDFALFGFTVPAPYTLHVTDIEIDTWNTGAAVATSATLLQWGCAVDQTAVSLATSPSGRIGLGLQAFAVAAAIGAQSPRIIANFQNAPLVTTPGRFFVIIVRVPVGTATASQVIQGLVNIHGYFE